MLQSSSSWQPDVVLVGAGIMSATLAVVLKELDSALNIEILETLGGAAEESSDAWNNAGTGHAALCELNYTPQHSDGSIDISKALEVNVEFDLSRQLWSYLVKKGAVADPKSFIHPIPHMSFVWGAEHVAFLRKRYAALTAHHCYHGMEYMRGQAEARRVDPARGRRALPEGARRHRRRAAARERLMFESTGAVHASWPRLSRASTSCFIV